MSLFLEERMAEQVDDPENDRITFTYPWILPLAETIVQLAETGFFITSLGTSFEMANESWDILLTKRNFYVTCCHTSKNNFDKICQQYWTGGTCYLSYVLYQDADMLIVLHSSPKIKMVKDPFRDCFIRSSAEFVTNLIKEKSATKAVIFIELELPSKPFYFPFERTLSKKFCKAIPTDMENDLNFFFFFLIHGDFTIECSDGTVKAFKIYLYLSSKFMYNQINAGFNGDRIIVQHSMEVVKPLIVFFHTFCFEMPEIYDLEYAQRLLKAIDFFKPYHHIVMIRLGKKIDCDIKATVHHSLCNKFVNESQTFDSILRWTSIACQHSLSELFKMVITTIAGKYYFKWLETFPVNERNLDNQLYRDVFGTENADVPHKIFKKVDKIVCGKLCTNVISY